MKERVTIGFLLREGLSNYETECIRRACRKFEDLYGELFAITYKCSQIDLNEKYVIRRNGPNGNKVYVLGEPLLEDIIETSAYDVAFLFINIPVIFINKQILPISMFCYDSDTKKASAVVSVDILHSSLIEEYVKNILVNIEHEIGEIILGRHCKNKICPLHFHRTVSDMRFSSAKYCEKCYQEIVKKIGKKFNRR